MPLGLRKISKFQCFRSISLEWIHILKWNFVYRYIKWKSRSSSYLGPIEKFLTELCPLHFEKYENFRVSVQYLWNSFTYWNEILYTDTSNENLGQVHIWVRSKKFWQSYAPCILKNIKISGFPFNISWGELHIEWNFVYRHIKWKSRSSS